MKSKISFILFSLMLALFFQNCSQTGFIPNSIQMDQASTGEQNPLNTDTDSDTPAAPRTESQSEPSTPKVVNLTTPCMNRSSLAEESLVESSSGSDKFFKKIDFETSDSLSQGVSGVLTTSHCFSGQSSIDSKSTVGRAFSTGGVIGLPSAIKNNGQLWVRFRIFFPSTYEFNSCTSKNLGNCEVTEGNDSIKFIGMDFNVYDQGRHWFNIGHDSLQNNNPFFWVNEMDGTSFEWITQDHYQASYPNADFPLNVQKGKWETFEYYTKLTTDPTTQGGAALTRIYKNGRLIYQQSTHRTINSTTMEIVNIYLLSYWNGGAPASQSVYFDDIIMTNKIPKKRDINGNPFLGQD